MSMLKLATVALLCLGIAVPHVDLSAALVRLSGDTDADHPGFLFRSEPLPVDSVGWVQSCMASSNLDGQPGGRRVLELS
jgi:hypothetical protein